MNYELAKELKEAGFPFEWGDDENFEKGENYLAYRKWPTLLDLIEAIPVEYGHFSLERSGDGWTVETFKGGSFVHESGDTPDEAVAKLWLLTK